MTRLFLFFIIGLTFSMNPVLAAIFYYSSSNYQGRLQNPFLGNPDLGIVYLEDFETQFGHGTNALTTPHATGWNGATVGYPFWGVQDDYSPTDADGGMGWWWSDASRGPETTKPPSGIHFDFSPDEHGRYPEYVGAALRGFGILGAASDFNTILVYDRNGVEVTDGEWLIPKPPWNPDQPIEDLFLNFEGIHVPGGISRILFRDFEGVDHLTYGYAPIPEPGPLLLAAPLAAAAAGLRRRPRRCPELSGP